MEKNTNELILEELIKINRVLASHTEILNYHGELLVSHTDQISKLNIKMDEGFKETQETMHYIGNKVFDNHEVRIKAIEKQLT